MTRAPVPDHRGFSLIELAVALLVVAVLATLAQPAFSTYMQNAQIRAAGEALLNGVQLARAEAVRRNIPVQFDLENSTSTGWTVSTVAGEVLQSRSAAEASPNTEVVVTPDTTRLTFNSLGRVVTPNPDASEPIQQIVIRTVNRDCATDTRMRCLRVRVTSGGSVRLCDPTYPADDPRGC